MRTAVLRVNVDPAGELTAAELESGIATLTESARALGAEVLDTDPAALPRHRREIRLLITTEHPETDSEPAIALCANAFGTHPQAGPLTYISRGTDDDAHGVLAGFGLTGHLTREQGPDGYDIINVTLAERDLARIPESRIHTALEAALNCEVRIRAR
ncbi:hypothetical protein ACFYTQ_13595 [Nocardia sp. NPDC004068]|uniref:hypothetical protein n=1 Tax=Nocardia sp. NPDC004068 TaxID=3364303 RepID=UPI0036A9DA13